ncbi:DNA-directed RNA polymerase III subunit RPC5 [Schistocerca piceifrons]|uniref:DNA-directed RNA polymerase III subunit RPC5 n=1 Tax=Schistocerca piceifrons TaxID=274613 RepID=UPI001F5F299C|nr:DNA-directed RNA polymerase III subunit RPC5 [Schistocerca piceifrons]
MLDDDDPVMQEIPVYLSRTLAEKLFLFQYPIKKSSIGYDGANVIQSCIKPIHQEVKLELELDTSNPNYDTSKGEQIALNVDGMSKAPLKHDNRKQEDPKYFQGTMMDKQVLQSTRAVVGCSQYAIAVVNDKELHATPLQGIVHLRPSFGYLDKSDKRAKDESKEKGDGENEDEEEEAEQVTVKFARQENDRLKRLRERSFGYLSKKSAEEPWYYTQYFGRFSEKAELEKAHLYCEPALTSAGDTAQMSLARSDYTRLLVPPPVQEEYQKQRQVTSETLSLVQLKQLPMVDQVRQLLLRAKIVQFSQLLSLLGQESDVAGLLRAIQQCAVLVRGNWVVRSDLLYPKDSFSASGKVPAEVMCRARDYILHRFTQERFVQQEKVHKTTNLGSGELNEILSQFAKPRSGRGWELLRPYDNDFITRYPDVLQRQQMMWEAKQKQLQESFSLPSTPATGRTRRQSTRDSDSDGRPVLSSHSRHRPSGDSDAEITTTPNNRRKSHKDSDSDSGAERPNHKIARSFAGVKVKVEPLES